MRIQGMVFVAALLAGAAAAQDVHVRVSPAVKTGRESTTEYPTIQMALDHHPQAGRGGRVYIEVAPAVYNERLIVTQNHENVTLLGMGKTAEEVVITNSLNAKQAGGTFLSATVEVNGTSFEADNVTFENTAGNTGQAVAIVIRADRAVFKRCRFLGHQDTLFADFGRQYYVDSYIEGGTDFIFGNATAVFERTEIRANAGGYLTAQSRTSPEQTTGYVILNSRVTSSIDHATAAPGHDTTYLGRPWRPYSRVVYINTELTGDVAAAGWDNWNHTEANEKTAYYAEYKSTGPGARAAERVAWSHQLSAAEMRQYLPGAFLAGGDHWDAAAEAKRLP